MAHPNYQMVLPGAPRQREPIPNNRNEFAVKVTDIENDNLSTEEKADLINQEAAEEEDTVSEENTPHQT